ncbi:MAG: hypothetical protein NT027_00570 [Proteobacteria bacterium]|nr:hypothetical protein [Pseudomonadota bacterium]
MTDMNEYDSTIATSKRTKVSLSVVWLALATFVIYGLMNEDIYFASLGESIASVKNSSQDVLIRSEDDIRWKSAVSMQQIYDGDRISTSLDGSATIDFGDGKKGLLGPDTIVSVNSIKQKNGKSFIINLFKGGIKPVVPAGSMSQLIVTSGINTFYVEAGETKAFTKPVSGQIQEFKSKEKFPSHSVKSNTQQSKYILPVSLVKTLEKLPTVAVEKIPVLDEPQAHPAEVVLLDEVPSPLPSPTPEPTQTPKAKSKLVQTPVPTPIVFVTPSINVDEFMPLIERESIPAELNTISPLSTLNKITFYPKLLKKNANETIKEIGINVQLGNQTKNFVANGEKPVEVLLNPSEVVSQFNFDSSLRKCIGIEFRAYIKTAILGKEEQKIGTQMLKSVFCGLSEAKGQLPLVVGVSNLVLSTKEGVTFQQKSSGSKYPFQILVTREADFLKLLPYVRGANSFKFIKIAGLTANGVFGASNGLSVVQFVGNSFSPKQLDVFLKLFGLSFVYRGAKSAIYDASAMDIDQFQNWIENSSGSGVYLPVNGSLILVSPGFVKERPEVASFVKKSSKTIFTSKVEIIAFGEK